MHRRTVLLGTGVVSSAVLAGCATEDEADETGADDADDDATAPDENGDDNGVDDEDATDDEGEDDADDEEPETDADGDLEERIEDEPPMEGLAVTDHELVEDDLSATVEGIVANETGEDLGPVEVGAVFYDADGEVVDESVTSTSELEDGEEWAFGIMSVADDVTGYAVDVVAAEPIERSPI
ncbi:FxLYD domain-containing protein [Natronococcus occultus]|uniref:Uncharacterized protein n=1 Tax=Natronococcus occultus SP4 TaxID=694430 RepID=L0JY30_9EURY|nr:FxLYD domain-containing protein [Natronococcus occultus]AGB36758.1 hypothetical protein Natoc_0909 [Natronococcus occultus SP4]